MSDRLLCIIAILINALVLTAGFKLRAVAIGGGTVSRDKDPVLFWAVMVLSAILVLACFGILLFHREAA